MECENTTNSIVTQPPSEIDVDFSHFLYASHGQFNWMLGYYIWYHFGRILTHFKYIFSFRHTNKTKKTVRLSMENVKLTWFKCEDGSTSFERPKTPEYVINHLRQATKYSAQNALLVIMSKLICVEITNELSANCNHLPISKSYSHVILPWK